MTFKKMRAGFQSHKMYPIKHTQMKGYKVFICKTELRQCTIGSLQIILSQLILGIISLSHTHTLALFHSLWNTIYLLQLTLFLFYLNCTDIFHSQFFLFFCLISNNKSLSFEFKRTVSLFKQKCILLAFPFLSFSCHVFFQCSFTADTQAQSEGTALHASENTF